MRATAPARCLTVLALPAFLTLPILVAGGLPAAPSPPSWAETPLVKAPWGAGPAEFAAGAPGAPFPGPIFDVDDDGIHLLDRLGSRLLHYDLSGAFTGADTVRLGAAPEALSDFRSVPGRFFFLLAPEEGTVSVLAWTRDGPVVPLPLLPLSELGEPPDNPVQESHKLVLAPRGLYLLDRIAQRSVLVEDGGPVPAAAQLVEEGLPVGAERLVWGAPTGEIRTVGGTLVAGSRAALRAVGNGCALIASGHEGRDVLELHRIGEGLLALTDRPPRERGPAANTGTRYRIRDDAYYELYFDDDFVHVSRWQPPPE